MVVGIKFPHVFCFLKLIINLEVYRACKEEKQLQRSSLKCEDFHDYKVIIIAVNKNATDMFLLE